MQEKIQEMMYTSSMLSCVLFLFIKYVSCLDSLPITDACVALIPMSATELLPYRQGRIVEACNLFSAYLTTSKQNISIFMG